MHGAGIYRQRYGLDPGLGLERAAEAQAEVDAFVAEQEAKFGGSPASGGPTTSCSSSSTGCRCTSACATSRRASRPSCRATAWSRSRRGTCRIEPYPFATSPGHFTLARRVIPKAGAPDLRYVEPELTAITVEG